jgi:hypothetical protein
LNFTIGILNGSILLIDNSTLDGCRNAIYTEWYNGYELIVNHALSKNYFGVAYEIFAILTQIDPIA